jgi:hypothetical protein
MNKDIEIKRKMLRRLYFNKDKNEIQIQDEDDNIHTINIDEADTKTILKLIRLGSKKFE